MEQRRGGFEGFSPVLGSPGWLFWAGLATLSWGSFKGQKFSFTSLPAAELQRTRPSPGCEANHGQNFRFIPPGAPLLSASSPVGESLCHPSHGSSTRIQPCHEFPLPTLTHGPARVTSRGEPFSLVQPPWAGSPFPLQQPRVSIVWICTLSGSWDRFKLMEWGIAVEGRDIPHCPALGSVCPDPSLA